MFPQNNQLSNEDAVQQAADEYDSVIAAYKSAQQNVTACQQQLAQAQINTRNPYMVTYSTNMLNAAQAELANARATAKSVLAQLAQAAQQMSVSLN